MATWRRKISEYEADLYRIEEPSFLSKLLGLRTKNGELEIKTYDDGEKVMEVELHGVRASNGVAVSVVVDNTAVCEVTVSQGHGRLVLSTAQGETIPEVSNGTVAEIHYLGETLLRGTFKPD